ncbi:MAG: hypothetical protein DWQ07_13070 [Chloroflexi bacterium]|nr:MAG: hypothetical protein DWQ07_13070 [Chloroflexota bacterium]MBL1196972.1 hypothetical protein [Chloroflexota bacterium]NOH14268.1 hypothetical protein [Chloroflexota bacterium]
MIDNEKIAEHKTRISNFSIVSAILGLIISFFVSGFYVWNLFGRVSSTEELFFLAGDLGGSYMLLYHWYLFPVIAEVSGLLILIIGFLSFRMKGDQGQFRKDWIAQLRKYLFWYPIIFIAITISNRPLFWFLRLVGFE